jgi:hypothetical protein
MVLCLAYCGVMALITIVYGIKFTLRGEELARQQDVTQWSGINITYFDNEVNASMMGFELNESIALDRAFVTLKELATRRFGNATNATDYDVDLYANDTVQIVRPVAEEEEEVYMILGQKGTDDSASPTKHASLRIRLMRLMLAVLSAAIAMTIVIHDHFHHYHIACVIVAHHSPPPCFAADPGARFITTSFMGLMMDICVMQPGRVLAVAVVMVCFLPSAICCLLFAVCYLLPAACCLLPAAFCLHHAARPCGRSCRRHGLLSCLCCLL